MSADRAAVSIRTAADMYDISQDSVRQAVNKGELAAKRVGRAIRIDIESLREWFRSLEDVREAS